MWIHWWTSRKSRRGNVNSLLRCSTFVLCWHICFLTTLVSRFQSKACNNFGTMLEATSHGDRTILQLQLLSMYQWDFMEIARATPTKLDSQRSCSASPWTFPSGIRSRWDRAGSWSFRSENPSWSTMFEHYGRSTGTWSPSWTSSSMLAFRSDQSRSAPTRPNASQWRSWGATGPTTATRTSCFGDGTRATSASSARRPWQAARSNIRILRTLQLGLGMNTPMCSSSTDASNLGRSVTWLYTGSCLLGGLEHFLFSHILGIITPKKTKIPRITRFQDLRVFALFCRFWRDFCGFCCGVLRVFPRVVWGATGIFLAFASPSPKNAIEVLKSNI